jgi:hypothetical protein
MTVGKILYVRINENTFGRLKKLAQKEHTHVADIIRTMIDYLLKNKPFTLKDVKSVLPSYHRWVRCKYCGKKFLKERKKLNKVKHHFCSRKCLNNYFKMKHRIELKCAVCGKKFSLMISEYKERLKRRTENTKDKWFCSKKCFGYWVGKTFQEKGGRKKIDLRKIIGPSIEYMTPKEIAEKIGYRRDYVYRLINEQKIKCIKKWSIQEKLKKMIKEVENESSKVHYV